MRLSRGEGGALSRGRHMTKLARLLSIPAFAAAAGLAVPVQAAPHYFGASEFAQSGNLATLRAANTANGWDRYRRYRRHRHDRVDAGDVIAGVLVLGGVLAVANAINNKNEREREVYRERYPYPADAQPYPDDRYRAYPQSRSEGRTGIEGAIDQCVTEVERSVRVDTVDEASRGGSGWMVEGELLGGGRYRCEIDSAGRIRGLDIDGDQKPGWSESSAGRNYGSGYDDDYYADARARQGMGAPDAGWADAESAETDQAGNRWPQDDWNSSVAESQSEDLTTGEGEQDWQRGETDDRYNTSDGPIVALAQ